MQRVERVGLAGAMFATVLGSMACHSVEPTTAAPLLYEVARRGAVVTLNKPVTIAVQQARGYIQGGAQVTAQSLDRWTPNCELEVRTLRDTVTTVKPDQFEVTRVVHDTEGSEGFSSSFSVGFGEASIRYITTIGLRSRTQPDVLQLTCSHIKYASRGHQMTMEQFDTAVGDYLSLLAAP